VGGSAKERKGKNGGRSLSREKDRKRTGSGRPYKHASQDASQARKIHYITKKVTEKERGSEVTGVKKESLGCQFPPADQKVEQKKKRKREGGKKEKEGKGGGATEKKGEKTEYEEKTTLHMLAGW